MVDLRRMRYLINRLPMARFRLDKAMAKATKVTTILTGMPRGGSYGDRMADNVHDIELARERYNEIRNELTDMRDELSPYIESLISPLKKSCMRLRYMDGKSVREIAFTLGYSEQHVFRILQQAESEMDQKQNK